MRTAKQFLAEVARIEAYPGGMDDPDLPEDLAWSARQMRAYRDAGHAPATPEQVARVARRLAPYVNSPP